MKKQQLANLIETIVRKQLNEQEMPLDLYMVIMSHLSDLQEQIHDKRLVGEINFIKALLSVCCKDGKRTMSEDEINMIYAKWVTNK